MFPFFLFKLSFIFFAVFLWPFYSIPLNSAELQPNSTDFTKELKAAAKGRSGFFSTDLSDATAEIIGLQTAATVGKFSLIFFSSGCVQSGNFTVKSFWIDSECTSCRIGLWGNCANLQLVLWTPNGVFVDRSITEKHIRKSHFEKSVFYDITAPAHGVWGIGIQCKKTESKQSSFHCYALARTRIRLETSSEIRKQDGVCCISIKCNVPKWSEKIHDMKVMAHIRSPQGESRQIELLPQGKGIFLAEFPCEQIGEFTYFCYLKAFTLRNDVLYRQTFPFSVNIPQDRTIRQGGRP